MRNNASKDYRRNFRSLLYPTTSAWPAAGGDIIAARNHAAEPEGIPRPPSLTLVARFYFVFLSFCRTLLSLSLSCVLLPYLRFAFLQFETSKM